MSATCPSDKISQILRVVFMRTLNVHYGNYIYGIMWLGIIFNTHIRNQLH